MLKYVAKLFRRDSEPRPNQAPSAPPSLSKITSAEKDEITSARREALARFMRLATAHLDDVESRRLMDLLLAHFDINGDSSEALEEVAMGNGGQKHGQCFVIQCDWKASEELEWQVAGIASSFGITERWTWGAGDAMSRTVPGGLCDAAHWAAARGFEMLHIDLGSDTYFAIMVRHHDAENTYQSALSAGLKVLRTPGFALSHA